MFGSVPEGLDVGWTGGASTEADPADGDLVVMPGGSARTAVGATAHQLAMSTPGLGLVAVHSATSRCSAGLGEVLGGGV